MKENLNEIKRLQKLAGLLNENHMDEFDDSGMSEYDKRYKNTDDDLTIFDVEVGKRDNSGPWATTATSSVLIHVMSREGENYSLDDILDWAIMVPGFKSSYMITRKIGEISEVTPGEWAFELETTVWQN